MYRKYQMARIIEVASLIHKEPRRWTRPRLAAHLEVDIATIQRYIDLLRDMGSEGQGRMMEKQKEGPLALTQHNFQCCYAFPSPFTFLRYPSNPRRGARRE